MSEQAEKYQRKHDFAPYTKADGNAVAEEFDAIQAHLDKVPALRNDGKGFTVSPVIPEPTEDNHPVTYGQLKNAENSVQKNKEVVTQKAREVAQNASQTALDRETAEHAKELAQTAEQTATSKAEIATKSAEVATQKANSITESATLAEQSKQSAVNSENNARKWAVNPEDEQVQNGEFSAYHHAVKARKNKESAEQSASSANSAKETALASAQTATEKASEVETALSQINQAKTTVEQKTNEALSHAAQAQSSAQTATEKANLIIGEADRAEEYSNNAQTASQSANESANRAEKAAELADRTLVENNLTSTSTNKALSAAMGKKLQDEKLGKDEAIFDKRRGYYYGNPRLSGKTVVRINLPANVGLTGIINISVLGSWGDENASGLIELRGAIGINPGRVWGQSLKCTQTFGSTKSNFYVEPIVHMGDGNTPYIKVHKRKNNGNPIYVYVELISDNGLKNKEITFSVDNSLSVIENKENEVLSSSIDSDSEEQPANSKAVKIVYDKAVEAAKKGMPLGSIVAFPKHITPHGYLKAIGGTFNQSTYPDLYVANGNSNVLPNLHRSDVGMTAYFPFDDIPDGWIAFDSIRSTVTQQNYPELYQYLIEKYGAISDVPLAEDRFIRNAGDGLSVGLTQGDAIRNITGEIDLSSLGSGNQFLEFDSSRNNEVFKGAILPNKAKWTNWTGDQNGGAETPRGFKFDASKVVPTANENRPKSVVLKLCIKAKDTFDDVQFWIKAFGTIENAGVLDAGTFAQNLQQTNQKIQDVENTLNQNQQQINQVQHRIEQLSSSNSTSTRKIWQGNVASESSILSLSESIANKNIILYLQPSSSHSLNNNDVITISFFVDQKLSEARHKRFLNTAFYDSAWSSLKVEVVNDRQIKLVESSGFFLKAITVS